MNTSTKSTAKFRRAFVPKTALAQDVSFDEHMMHVSLTDGRIISLPLVWFPLLVDATPEQRAEVEIGGGGVSLHWPAIDEDLVVANFLAGADWQST
jgi:hypothetical protein